MLLRICVQYGEIPADAQPIYGGPFTHFYRLRIHIWAQQLCKTSLVQQIRYSASFYTSELVLISNRR